MGKELFDNIPSKVADLLADVKNGRIGLPDLQRPFVWQDNKVRELLDSMMKGYPIGYIMLWASPDDYENTGYIGKNDKMYKRPDDLVIDGQQRLTALLAAMYGVTIKDKNYKERKIRISFNPLSREFAVWTQAFERNPEWISEINWHAFMNLFASAGYLRSSLVASSNAVVFSYVLYLIGKNDFKVPSAALQKIIRKWIFMSTITGFYTGSTESEVEKQFADLRNIHNANEFVEYLDSVISNKFTDDYFEYSLPSELNSSSATSPAWYGYVAAINVLGTPMLFSTTPLSQYFVLGTSGDKNSVDKHHIFPKHYLEKIGYDNDRERNQIANFTYLDYTTNIDISDAPPAEYVGRYREKLGEEGYKLACAQNALPENFEQLSYPDFLNPRRLLMAQIVKKAYAELNK